MPALVEIAAVNFRSLGNVVVPLRGFNVLVGPNGAGKSNLLDVIRFLGDSVRSDLAPALDDRGGFDRVCFRGAKRRQITIRVVAQVTSYSSSRAHDEYVLTFSQSRATSRRRRYLLREESFKFKRTRGQGRRITIDGANVEVTDEQRGGAERTERRPLLRSDSLGLATLPRLAESEGGTQVNQIAQLFSSFRVFEIDVIGAKKPSRAAEADHLEADASNLAAFLLRLRNDELAFTRLVEDARAFVPGLKELHFVPVGGADEAVAIELEEDWLPGRTRLGDASYGTVRALALLALLYDPNPPRLTCVEEIDHGLHPYVFDRLVDRLREAAGLSQYIVATHSPALVNRLDPAELIVCERDDQTGASIIPALSYEQAKEVATEATALELGELWFSGTLGGVPG